MQAEKTKRKKRHIISKFLKTIDEEKKILSSNKKKKYFTHRKTKIRMIVVDFSSETMQIRWLLSEIFKTHKGWRRGILYPAKIFF